MGVLGLFDRGAALFPNRTCLIDGPIQRSYAEVKRRTQAIAGALHANGAADGGPAAVFSPNCAALLESMLGIYRAGVVYVPLNARNHIDENIYILNRYRVGTLFYHSSFEPLLPQIRKECPGVRRLICIDRAGKAAPDMESWMAGHESSAPIFHESRDRASGIHSTGGTTGRPKGVLLTPLVWDTAAANLFAAMPCPTPPMYLVAAPITHAAGSVAICLFSQGATIVIHEHFDAAVVLAAIEAHRITHIWLPPTAIYMLLAHPNLKKHDYSSLQCFMYAAAPMSVDKLKQCLDVFGPVMAQSFGQTEAPMYCTWLSCGDHAVGDPMKERRLASCGRAMLFTPVEIMDEQGMILPPGKRGEIVARGNLLMAGYFEDPKTTAETIVDGWLRTGDVGYKDEDGYVFIVDRKKQMIITGGLNVYPSEIEQVILSHDAVQDCAVIGVPDEKWGEAVKAVIELKPGAAVDPEIVIALCKQRLGSVKAPKTVEFWPAIPRTPVGKVDKKIIREKYWRDAGRTI